MKTNIRTSTVAEAKATAGNSNINNLIRILALILAMALGACCASNNGRQIPCGSAGRPHYAANQPFNDGPEYYRNEYRRDGGSRMTRVLAFDVHVDHQSRDISEAERQAFFRGFYEKGASEEEVREAFKEHFESPNATFIFRRWSNPSARRPSGREGEIERESGMSLPEEGRGLRGEGSPTQTSQLPGGHDSPDARRLRAGGNYSYDYVDTTVQRSARAQASMDRDMERYRH